MPRSSREFQAHERVSKWLCDSFGMRVVEPDDVPGQQYVPRCGPTLSSLVEKAWAVAIQTGADFELADLATRVAQIQRRCEKRGDEPEHVATLVQVQLLLLKLDDLKRRAREA